MYKRWYPVIDYEKCIGCLSCVEFCPHEVFVEKDGKPSVINPDNCVEFCRGCQRGACSSGAISFAGSLAEAIADGRIRIKEVI
ncbi:MAG: 4Fe-4S ferredoxin [Caldiserica bacterium CG02_land_8_20_14_3_00_36_38]|jgi:NAD-dependent dihydropyrimidine dehydrogenase PreA subunit|nr:ferredoxin family protein [Caldisericota bacterium]OIP12184.1 MAG: 4Fe-4S ferredoxin [Caldisericum sp. CG2_30_36_11]PIP49902.1 MAG: 4Fe-4S ferredoxin [Caldiserica bacterium CG23_combo_of_CG06-09_8_20_14_all_35_60]PIV55528.1 MAG: 4Fe-4S ferredoxin [Caldiserica bacterium CG02_land_8_20_14_3_00_36_38]PIW10551.1 MAG: 4Fe-4S ferredoxin [Caldiserica bacterium CG17_big_fil_post_rev_8_21_14_2_50_35_7]